MAFSAESRRVALIGPDPSRPCGIADYVAGLFPALAAACECVFVPFGAAGDSPDLAGCRAILVHYERSLVPDPGFLPRLGARFPGRVYVVPHEVHAEDPFAYPYASLRSALPPLLWAKRALYRWRHRDFARELRLQGKAYGAHRIIPLCGPNAELLASMAPGRVLSPVPLAMPARPAGPSRPLPPSAERQGGPGAEESEPFPRGSRVAGVFGFLNPATDYGQCLDLLAAYGEGLCLLIVGGDRGDGRMRGRIEAEAARRGLAGRVRITGWLGPDEVDAHLGRCDLFLAPMRFKSNSASLLRLIGFGRPILASDLPLTRWLKGEGAPFELYRDAAELRSLVSACLDGGEGEAAPPPNRYRWDFPAVARAYLEAMGVAFSSASRDPRGGGRASGLNS